MSYLNKQILRLFKKLYTKQILVKFIQLFKFNIEEIIDRKTVKFIKLFHIPSIFN